MFLLTLRDKKDEGAYAVPDMYGDKVVEGYYKMERKDGTWMSWLNGIKVEQKTFVKDTIIVLPPHDYIITQLRRRSG